jgi:HAD superfamily hydrolase (TIGR01450 family)
MGKRIAYLSNNSVQGAEEVAAKLRGMGIEARPDDVSLPTDLVGEFLLEAYGPVSVYPIGNARVTASIAASGHRLVVEEGERCDVVFVARDPSFSYHKLERAARYLARGAVLAAANPDDYHTGNDGVRVPETGAILASISSVSGKTAVVLGKPEPFLFEKALAKLGLRGDRVLMIGDNPSTDIAGAAKTGLSSVWIDRAGEAAEAGVPSIRAYRDLSEFLDDLRGGNPDE